jgi:hypothetical protein
MRSPDRSARKHSAALGVSDRTVRRILHEDLSFHPYKILITQQLQDTDHGAPRKSFAELMLAKLADNEIPLDCLMISDEAHFHLSGVVNKQNYRYWSDSNPKIIHEQPLHSPKVTVWAGISQFGIIGPYFFTGTINRESYIDMIENYVVPELKKKHKYSRVWFQQDGATCHTAHDTMEVLKKHFNDRIVSRGMPISWPPRSPDLSVCDFFLWGYLKARVYRDKPRDLEHLKRNIRREMAAIPKGMLQKVFANFVKRLEECRKLKGQHLRSVIFSH